MDSEPNWIGVVYTFVCVRLLVARGRVASSRYVVLRTATAREKKSIDKKAFRSRRRSIKIAMPAGVMSADDPADGLYNFYIHLYVYKIKYHRNVASLSSIYSALIAFAAVPRIPIRRCI